MPKRRKKADQKRTASLSALGVLILGVLALWTEDGLKRAFQKPSSENIHQTSSQDVPAEGGEGDSPEVRDASLGVQNLPAGYSTVTLEENSLHNGLLLQVDAEHPYTGSAEGMTTFEEGRNGTYYLRDFTLSIQPEALTALNAMCAAYAMEDWMVYSTTEVFDDEYALYQEEIPDRATGYCVDLCVRDEDASLYTIDEPLEWLKENAYQYGFVQNDTEAPYHLRYVGEAHASAMHDQNMTLTEYLSYVKGFSVSQPMQCTASDGTYSVYYVAENAAGQVPVPQEQSYTISGNHVDGWIVSVKN